MQEILASQVWSWFGMIPWRRAWQPTPVFLPRESPWSEEPGRLQSTRSQRVRYDWARMHEHTHKASCVSQSPWNLLLRMSYFSLNNQGSLFLILLLWSNLWNPFWKCFLFPQCQTLSFRPLNWILDQISFRKPHEAKM